MINLNMTSKHNMIIIKYNITEGKDKITFQISAIKKKTEKNYPKSEVNRYK